MIEWVTKNLGEVCEFYNGQAHENNIDENGKFILINSKFISSDGASFKRTNNALFHLKKGDIVMVMSDVPNGKALAKSFLVDEDNKYTLNQRICAIRSKNFDQRFLWYQLNRNKYFLEFDNGENQTNLRKNDILDCPLVIPSSEEQKRIVEILDEAFALIDRAKANIEKNLQNVGELFESYLHNVFLNKGDDWQEKRLGDVCEYDKTQNVRKDLPYVGLEHIESNTGRFLGSLKPQIVKSSTFFFTKAHVLYGRLRPYLNKVLLPDFDGHCSTEIFPIKVSKELNRRFLFYWLTLPETVKKIDATWTGARMPRANMNVVIDFEFSLPPLNEQLAIVKVLDKLSEETSKLKYNYQQKLDYLEELKKSILQKAFTGELKTEKAVVL